MANPTTNYGFVLPTSTDLVTDLPADFDVALQGVDTRLKALQPGTTLGDLMYASATANTNTRLGIGTTGQVLTVAGGVPAWSASAGGGKVLQVIYGNNATDTSNATGTYADTGLTASITPSSATSKVLVLVNQVGVGKTSNDTNVNLRLMRGATSVIVFEEIGGTTSTTATNFFGSCSTSFLDTPATTSATTYKTQFSSGSSNSQAIVQGDGGRSTMVLLEIGA